jgi:hypothetical protein
MKRSQNVILCLPLLLLLGACSSEAPKAAAKKVEEPAQPPEPVSAQWAFHQMYLAARSWAADAQPLRLANVPLPEFKSAKGKAGAWQATFVSDSLGRARTFTYSVVEAGGNLHKGVFAGLEEGWSGSSGQAKPFLVAAFKVDATAALETALKKGAEYAKKHPDMPINFLLEATPRFPDPVWRVIWGESVGTSGFSILVDATTGEYRQTLR